MKFLVTGGPVHAHLDDVKIITNKFRGGRMEALAEELVRLGHEVIYLTARHTPPKQKFCTVWLHDGFNDYREKIFRAGELGMDAFVLGAAVANLIPASPWKGKFPSHQYKPGDKVDIPFLVAPRIINDVRNKFPESKLFGFKLLSGAPYTELINAAYEVALDSRATVIFANDAKNLDRKYAVTKDMVVQSLRSDELSEFIIKYTDDVYYRTEIGSVLSGTNTAITYAEQMIAKFSDKFQPAGSSGLVFGTVACRIPGHGLSFVTTRRGKTEIGGGWETVSAVWHEDMVVKSSGKSSLNAPLLHWIFAHMPETKAIVHYHQIECPELHVLPYAPPGTRRDSQRDIRGSFSIQGHGAFLLFGENGQIPWK